MTTDDSIGPLAWVMMKEYPEDVALRASLRAEALTSFGGARMGTARGWIAAIPALQAGAPLS
jgi:hypothetical protein